MSSLQDFLYANSHSRIVPSLWGFCSQSFEYFKGGTFHLLHSHNSEGVKCFFRVVIPREWKYFPIQVIPMSRLALSTCALFL